MADDNSTAPTAPVTHVRPGDLLNELLEIKGAVQLSRRAAGGTMDLVTIEDHPEASAATISAIEGTLAITDKALERFYERLCVLDSSYSGPNSEVHS